MFTTIRLRGISCEIHYEEYPATAANAPWILLIHGHSSSTQEFVELIPAIAGRAHVFALDLPNCGRSSDVDAADVRFAYASHPSLHYLHELIASFVRNIIERRLPPNQKLRVAGGSLGGNLGLWLGCRSPGYTWLGDVMVWSPGSAWNVGFSQVMGGPVALGRARENWDGRRIEFLIESYVKRIAGLFPPQPYYWYADDWGGGPLTFRCNLSCPAPPFSSASHAYAYQPMTQRKARAIEASLASANANYRGARAAWHWQVAGDQLVFSHRTVMASTGAPAIASLSRPTLMMAGVHDNRRPVDLHRATRDLAQAANASPLCSVPVHFEEVQRSGHSIHNERPDFLASVLLRPPL